MRDQFEARARKIARDTGCGDDWTDTIADILRAAVDLSRAPTVHPEAAPRAEAPKPVLTEWHPREKGERARRVANTGRFASIVREVGPESVEWSVCCDGLRAAGTSSDVPTAKRAADATARQWYTLPEDRAPGRLPVEPTPPSEAPRALTEADPWAGFTDAERVAAEAWNADLHPRGTPWTRPEQVAPAWLDAAEKYLRGDDGQIGSGDGVSGGSGRAHETAKRVAAEIRARTAPPPGDTLESLRAERDAQERKARAWQEACLVERYTVRNLTDEIETLRTDRDRLARDLAAAQETIAGWRDMAGIVRKALGAGDGESIPSAAVRVAGERDEACGKVQSVRDVLDEARRTEREYVLRHDIETAIECAALDGKEGDNGNV